MTRTDPLYSIGLTFMGVGGVLAWGSVFGWFTAGWASFIFGLVFVALGMYWEDGRDG